MNPRKLAAVGLTLLFTSFTTAMADNGDALHPDDAWARATPPGAGNAAGYLTIHNHGGDEDRLTGARIDIADSVEIHRSTEEDGMARMEQMSDGLTVPADGMVSLSPGGYHLMFLGLEKELVKGDSHELTLIFEQAGEQRMELKVRSHDTEGSHDHHHH